MFINIFIQKVLANLVHSVRGKNQDCTWVNSKTNQAVVFLMCMASLLQYHIDVHWRLFDLHHSKIPAAYTFHIRVNSPQHNIIMKDNFYGQAEST